MVDVSVTVSFITDSVDDSAGSAVINIEPALIVVDWTDSTSGNVVSINSFVVVVNSICAVVGLVVVSAIDVVVAVVVVVVVAVEVVKVVVVVVEVVVNASVEVRNVNVSIGDEDRVLCSVVVLSSEKSIF